MEVDPIGNSACVIHLSFNLNCKPTNHSPLSVGHPAGEASVIKKQNVFVMASRSLTPVTYGTRRDKESYLAIQQNAPSQSVSLSLVT